MPFCNGTQTLFVSQNCEITVFDGAFGGSVVLPHGMSGATAALQQLQAAGEKLPTVTSRRNGEAANIHTAALLITRSALARLESRGAHYRTDYPEHDDAKFKKHSIAGEKGVRFV